ncbi:recombination regulator RecX [Cytobacillus spongiae]|uniref:recombination regulator RecX n=1 Tax=Cytobacillus spongiae TaxID=2901381 RepID=UPI001F346C5A|nr:recombination regulator RecX [Cytobacillus spongiae]UII57824.1 recombination regulator RecX [Cytobacillus spongiae]
MNVITKITVQQKNKDRYNIFTDDGNGEKYSFSVDEDTLIKFHLKKGKEIDELLLSEIGFQDDIQKAYNLSIHYLSRRMRSETEVRDYLKQKEIDEPIIQEAIHKLYNYQFLNDEEFAFAFVRTQKNTTDKGPVLAKRELMEKGISEAIIEQVMSEYLFEEQLEKAVQLCQKYIQKNNKDSKRVLEQKLESMLVRKGYSYQVISIAIEEVEDGTDHDNEEMEALRFQGAKAHRKNAHLTGYEYSQKMKQTLYRKGFSIELIERFLAEIEEE